MDKLSKGDLGGGQSVTLPSGIQIRPFAPGEASYISYLHMKLYDRVYGWHIIFEHYVMKSMAEFIKDPDGGQIWVALDGERIVGGIAMVRSAEPDTAQLRWYIIEEEYQGKGIGRALMETAMGFASGQGYRKVFLWTVSKLHAARHLYERQGFVKTQEVRNTEWADEELTEERWDVEL